MPHAPAAPDCALRASSGLLQSVLATIVRIAAPAGLRAPVAPRGGLGPPIPLIVPVALRRIAGWWAPAALEDGAEAVVAPVVAVRNDIIGRRLPRDEAALRLVAQ